MYLLNTYFGPKMGQAINGKKIKLLVVLTTKLWSENWQELRPKTSCATISWFTFAAVNYLGKRQKQEIQNIMQGLLSKTT